MNSNSLEELGFKEWRKLVDVSASIVPLTEGGVIIIRDQGLPEGGKGTDIVYIGSAKKLKKKIFVSLIGGEGGRNNRDLHKALMKEVSWERAEISWIVAKKGKTIATDLLKKFHAKYKKYPLLN